MARLLDQPLRTDADGHDDIAPDLAARMQHLHREMVFVLAAYVEHADLAPGRRFIPYDGWDYPVAARCVPVTDAEIEAYKHAITLIDMVHASGSRASNEIGARLKAN